MTGVVSREASRLTDRSLDLNLFASLLRSIEADLTDDVPRHVGCAIGHVRVLMEMIEEVG